MRGAVAAKGSIGYAAGGRLGAIGRCASALICGVRFPDLANALWRSGHAGLIRVPAIEALGVRMARPIQAPLLRFGPLQRLLAALRYPGLPAAGRSRFGFGWRVGFTRVFPGRTVKPASVPLRFFAVHSHRPPSDAEGCECRSPQVMHRGLSIRDVPLPAFIRAFRGSATACCRGDAPGVLTLRRLGPECEASGRLHPSFPTCRWVNFHLDLFSSRDRPSEFVSRARKACPWALCLWAGQP